MKNVPDLLNREPQEQSDLDELKDMLQFAFSSGESAGDLRGALAECDVSKSRWIEACFAADLFVDELIESCFCISKDRFKGDYTPPQDFAYFRKVLLHPPASFQAVVFRQEIQKELSGNPELRARFEKVYRKLTELREELDSAGVMGIEYSTGRRIDILILVKETVDMVAGEFSGASSGLVRIREWAREFQEGEGYSILRDFVDYEGRLSSVQLQVRVGLDGTMRCLKIVELAENEGSRFYQTPLGRVWEWSKLLIRGYKVGSGELVARMVEYVFDAIDEPLSHFLILIGHMEFHLAALSFAELCKQNGLPTSYPDFVEDKHGIELHGLFNPLLFNHEKVPVACDLKNNGNDAIMVITGPNSGGKTRLLQALGILQILGQGGLAVPARKAAIHFKKGLFLSLMEHPRADQDEGKLGMELLRIRRLFEQTPQGALIILDELCSGTNPSEGEEIFLLVLSLLKELTPEVFITTHFLRFAQQLENESSHMKLEFNQVELDENQEPTYKFIPGVAQTALAGHTAKRLGVTREHLLSLIEKQKSQDSREVQ